MMRPTLLLLLIIAAPLQAQSIPVGGWLEDYARLLQLTGVVPVTPVTVRPNLTIDRGTLAAAKEQHPWMRRIEAREPLRFGGAGPVVELRPAEFRVIYNDDRPWGWNDGAIWQGKGLTTAATFGVDARWGRVSLTLAPLVTHNTNVDFDLFPLPSPPGLSRWAYPVASSLSIDAPQQFGEGPFSQVDWGSTNLRADLGPISLGISHENLWWGPGIKNDILMTNNAPGFWHAQLSTARPLSIGIGKLSGRWVWGSLRESAYFDTVSANDRRFVTGLALSFVPRGAPGIELGAARVFQQSWDSPGLEQLLWVGRPLRKVRQATAENPYGEDDQDQLASIWARWALPASGLEIYGEWAKGDHSADFRDLMVEPEHGSGWLFGLQKVVTSSPRRSWRFASEVTILGAPRSTRLRSPDAGFFYVHYRVRQGYTHRGQILGAGIGPGSSQVSISLDRFAPWGKLGASVFRTVYDNDRFYLLPGRNFVSHEVEPSLALDATVFRGPLPLDLTGSITASHLLNRHYLYKNDRWNRNVSVGARYHFASRR